MVVSGTQVNVFTDVNALFGLAFGLALERGFFPFNEFFDGLVKFLQLLVCDAINVTVADGDAVGCFALVHGVGRLFLFYLPGALSISSGCIVLFFIHNDNVLKVDRDIKDGPCLSRCSTPVAVGCINTPYGGTGIPSLLFKAAGKKNACRVN